MFKRNTDYPGFQLGQFISTTDGSEVTTGTPTCTRIVDGVAGSCENAASYDSTLGAWVIDLDALDLNGAIIGLTFKLTGCFTLSFLIKTETAVANDLGKYPIDISELRRVVREEIVASVRLNEPITLNESDTMLAGLVDRYLMDGNAELRQADITTAQRVYGEKVYEITDSDVLNITSGSFSLLLSVCPQEDDFGSHGFCILGKWNTSSTALCDFNLAYSQASGCVQFHVYNSSGTSKQVNCTSFGAFTANTWYWILAYYDEATDIIYVKINNDATKVNYTAVATASLQTPSATTMRLGAFLITGALDHTYNLHGTLGDVQIWNRVLTTVEQDRAYENYLQGRDIFGNALPTGQLPRSGGSYWSVTPRGYRYHGAKDQTFYGMVDSIGDVKLATYDNDTGITSHSVVHATLDLDDHDIPSICVRNSDKKILLAYSKHGAGAHVYTAVSKNSEDGRSWNTPTDIGSTVRSGGNTSYANLIQLCGETDEPLHLFFRSFGGTEASPGCYRTISTDGGVTFPAATRIYENAPTRPYMLYYKTSETRIDFCACDAEPLDIWPVPCSIHHFYYEGNKFYQTDGTEITGGLPMDETDVTTVYDATGTDTAWNWDIAIDSDGNPCILYCTYDNYDATGGTPTYDEQILWYAKWNGTAWISKRICGDFGPIPGVMPLQYDYGCGACFAAGNPSVIYVCRLVDGQSELFRYTTGDGGVSFSFEQITYGSVWPHFRPWAPFGGDINDLLWVYGSYQMYQMLTNGGFNNKILNLKNYRRLPFPAKSAVTVAAGDSVDSLAAKTAAETAQDRLDGTTPIDIDSFANLTKECAGTITVSGSDGDTYNGVYYPVGQYGDQPYWSTTGEDTYYIWKDTSGWAMSAALGVTGTNYYSLAGTSPIGTWVGHGAYSATPTTTGYPLVAAVNLAAAAKAASETARTQTTASAIRAVLGLATANLDTQLSGLEGSGLTEEQAAQLTAVKAKTDLIGAGDVKVRSPIDSNLNIKIVRHDIYTGSMITWTNEDGTWVGGDLTDATLTFTALQTLGTITLSKACVIITPTGTQVFALELTSVQSALFVAGQSYPYEVLITKTGYRQTSIKGKITSSESLNPPA